MGAEDWVIALGDVCGKGQEAAIVTTLVRHTLRALCVGEERPSVVLAALDKVLRQHPTDRFCTAVLLRLKRQPSGWLVTLSLGGHPEPLLLRAGRPPELYGAHGSLLGVVDDPTFQDNELRLGPGDVLLLYTDGIVEGRSRDEFYGEQRLLHTVERLDRDPSALVKLLVQDVLDFQDGTMRDDVAVLAFGPPA